MPINYPVPNIPMLGKGSVLLDIFDSSGNPTGFQHLGNCTKFEVDIKDDLASLYQSMNSTVSLIAQALKQRTPKVMITGTDFSSLHMQITQVGYPKTTLVISAGTQTNETLISATAVGNCKGRFFRTAFINIDNTTVLPVLKQSSTTLVVNTDYQVVDAEKGIFYIPLTSTIVTTGALVSITYNTLAGNFDQVAAGTVPFIQAHLLFVPDPVDGQKIGCDIWRVNLNPTGQIGLVADEYGNWSLDGGILDDVANHPLSRYLQYTFL